METRPVTSSSSSSHLLRYTLRANSIFCMFSGLLLTAVSQPIATFLGWNTFIPLIVIGVLLLLYGAVLFRRMARAPINSPRTGMVYALADTAWVIVSLFLLLTNLVSFTTEGKWAIAIQAVIVAVFALLQFIGAQRIKRSII